MQTKSRLSSAEVVELADITYRQLDYWTRQRWVVCTPQWPGSGQTRTYTLDEAKRVALMGKMVAAGIPPLDAHMLTLRGEYDAEGVFRASLFGHVYVEVFP
jgi:hypothetical protein